MYTAVMMCKAPLNDVVVNVAIGPDKAIVPRGLDPSKNVTVPVAPVVTEAVKVTESPKLIKLAEDCSVVVVAVVLTVCVSTLDVLVANEPSPV